MLIDEVLAFLKKDGAQFEFSPAHDGTFEVKTFSSLNDIADNCICWIKNKSFASDSVIATLREHIDAVVVCPFKIDRVHCIITPEPKRVIFSILNEFFSRDFEHEISPAATVLTDKIGRNVHIGPGCYICADVEIGDNTIIHPNVSIISPCRIGHDCEIFSGAVIGADGANYYKEGDIYKRSKHFKGVVIGNNVDIGANTCIDRGLLVDTVIGDNVKIDNLCQIAHNDRIEDNCLILGGVHICGSVTVKKGAYIAPHSVIMNQASVGENAMVGLGSVVLKRVRDGVKVFGNPALPLEV